MSLWPIYEEEPRITCTTIMKHYFGNQETDKKMPEDDCLRNQRNQGCKRSPSSLNMYKKTRRSSRWNPSMKIIVLFVLLTYVCVPYFMFSFRGTTRSHTPKYSFDGFPSRLFPFRLWDHQRAYPEAYEDGNNCGAPPSKQQFRQLKSPGLFWQTIPMLGGVAHGYAAYYDARGRNFGKGRVRVLVYSEVAPIPRMYCQLWYYNSAVPMVVPAEPLYAWSDMDEPQKDSIEPYIFTCDPVLATRGNGSSNTNILNLAAVSIVRRPCDQAQNIFNVQNAPLSPLLYNNYNLHLTQNWRSEDINNSVGVCIKIGNIQDDVSTRLTEWLQFLRRFGVTKVYFYMMMSHVEVLSVLDYYDSIGFMDITPLTLLTLPATRTSLPPSEQRKLAQKLALMPNNDCLYRNLHKHRWITMLDMDEMIVPMAHPTWDKLVQLHDHDETTTFDAFTFDKYYFPPLEQEKRKALLENENQNLFGAPGTVILNHVWRSRLPSGSDDLSKSLIDVQKTLAWVNHSPIWCRSSTNITDYETSITTSNIDAEPRRCNVRHLSSDVGRMYQYKGCGTACDPNDLIKDDILLQRYPDIGDEVLFYLRNIGRDTTSTTTPSGNL